MENKMTDTNEQKWREEFEALQFKYKNNLERSWNGYVDGEIHSRWIMYEAARKKAQEEIERLHKKVTSLHGGYDEAVIIFNGECEKRDKLLEQAKPIMVLHHMDCVSGGDTEEQKEVEQWLKSYKELKR